MGSLLSLMPEKVQKPSQRLMSLWLKRELLGIGTLAMLATDSEIINAALLGTRRNRRVRAGEGFNRRVSISVL